MPVTKSSIMCIVKGRAITVSTDAVDLVNGIVDKVLAALFPKDSSAVLENIEKRYMTLLQENPSDLQQYDRCIPEETIKKMIQVHAGNVTVPIDSNKFATDVVQDCIFQLLSRVVENDEGIVTYDQNKPLEGKHIIRFLYETGEGRESPLHRAPIGPLDKKDRKKKSSSKKRRSSSKKRRSSSKKRCSSGKISVRGFRRSGRSIKSYCRKK